MHGVVIHHMREKYIKRSKVSKKAILRRENGKGMEYYMVEH